VAVLCYCPNVVVGVMLWVFWMCLGPLFICFLILRVSESDAVVLTLDSDTYLGKGESCLQNAQHQRHDELMVDKVILFKATGKTQRS